MASAYTPRTTPTPALLGALLVVLVGAAGCHIGTGPQIGYTFGKDRSGLSYGWETSGGVGPLHLSTGQVARSTPGGIGLDLQPAPAAEATDADTTGSEWVFYGSFEPGYVFKQDLDYDYDDEYAAGAGGTIGYAWGTETGHSGALGVWSGLSSPTWGEPEPGSCPFSELSCNVVITASLGLRYLADGLEIYLAPKVVLIRSQTPLSGQEERSQALRPR